MTHGLIEIRFRFVPRAARVGSDTARISNVPFLRNGVAGGHVVRFVSDAG